MQIAEKYKKDYVKGLSRFYIARKAFLQELSEIKDIEVMPTQANYVCLRLTGAMSAKELARELLVNYNILIKDLSAKIGKLGKTGEYVRIAVRSEKDNEKLVQALRQLLDK